MKRWEHKSWVSHKINLKQSRNDDALKQKWFNIVDLCLKEPNEQYEGNKKIDENEKAKSSSK